LPFRSKAQIRKFAQMVNNGEMSEEEFRQWLEETGDIKDLPEKVRSKKKAKRKGRNSGRNSKY